jgi:hypothetical protein
MKSLRTFISIVWSAFFLGASFLAVSAGLLVAPATAHAQSSQDESASKRKSATQERETWDPAVLVVVTNFTKADVKVNGLPYPDYVDESEEPGMVLPAGGPYRVEVSYDGNTKLYRVYLKAFETRLLMVDLTGFNGGGPVASRPRRRLRRPEREEKRESEEGMGRVTVYSKPKGDIMVDGRSTGEQSPGTVDVEPGRHEIQVRFEDGEESEQKIVRVREGSRIKLFFREKN